MSEQHDDHIWLTVLNEPWAIQCIERAPDGMIFHLWRGYAPDLECWSVQVLNPDWDGYCTAARAMLREHFGDQPCLTM